MLDFLTWYRVASVEYDHVFIMADTNSLHIVWVDATIAYHEIVDYIENPIPLGALLEAQVGDDSWEYFNHINTIEDILDVIECDQLPPEVTDMGYLWLLSCHQLASILKLLGRFKRGIAIQAVYQYGAGYLYTAAQAGLVIITDTKAALTPQGRCLYDRYLAV